MHDLPVVATPSEGISLQAFHYSLLKENEMEAQG